MELRVGQGYDIHRLVEKRALVLGGVRIESERGCDAHSDGDVLIHAVIDALLGAASLGDIGAHFPPSDERWKNADSGDLLKIVMTLMEGHGWRPINIDSTVILERPRLRPQIDEIRISLARLTGLQPECISVKGKTKEKQDAVGEGRAVEAQAITLIARDR
jgi:2-C-methyl-D-erythritol 2,4-cyclodiphosphate synthase